MAEHTPTPWRVDFARWTPDSPICGFGIRSGYSHPNLPSDFKMAAIASANISERAAYTACFTPEEIEANAAFIVKAVNCHEMLVKTLEGIAEFCSGDASKIGAIDRLTHIRNSALNILGHVGGSQ